MPSLCGGEGDVLVDLVLQEYMEGLIEAVHWGRKVRGTAPRSGFGRLCLRSSPDVELNIGCGTQFIYKALQKFGRHKSFRIFSKGS